MTAMKESKILLLFSRPYVIVPFLLILIALSYANTLYSPFVFDDMHSFIEEPNVYVRDFSYDSFSKLSSTFFGKARIIPLLTFSLNHYMAQGQMPIYHTTNIIIHLLVTLFVYWFTATLLRTPVGTTALRGIPATYFAFFAAALWALNPVQTNAVTYIVQRMTSIAALFYIAALTFYVKGRLAANQKHRILLYLLSVGMAMCAIFSKENSYIIPAAICLLEWLFFPSNFIVKILRRMKWYHWVGILLLVSLLMPLFEHRWMSILNSYNNIRPFSLGERLLTEARVVVYYISLLMLPLPGRMNFEYDFPLSTSIFSPLTTVLAFILISLALVWSFQRRKQYPLITFGVFWYFLNLLIESTVIPLELVFEHRLYLPSVGLFIACLATLDLFVAYMKTKRSSREVEQVFVLVMVIVVSFFSIGTTVRNNVWRDSYALYSDSAEKSPNKPRVYLNLGVAMGRDPNLERESIEVFEKVIALGKPKKERYIQAATNIVVSYANLGEYEEAIVQGEKYLEEAPDYVKGEGYSKLMNNLAYAYNKTGQYSEAMQALVSGFTKEHRRLNRYLVNAMLITLTAAYDYEEYRSKLELTEENGNKILSVRLRVGRLLSDLRDYERANYFLEEIIENHPEHELARELYEKNQDQLQKNRKQEELMDVRNHPPYKTSLIYKISFNLSDFILDYYSPLNFTVDWLLDKAERVSQPDDPFVLWYWIKWYNETGNREKLVQKLEEAARLQPDFVPLLRLTGEYYELIGEQDKATEIYGHILEIYPGEPAWLKYETRIAEYKEHMKQNE
jgi:tetratricopeptide (TPR) repeat protein